MNGVLFMAASAALSFVITAVMQKILIPQERLKSLNRTDSRTPFLLGGTPFALSACVAAVLMLGINSLTGNIIGIEQSLNTRLWAGICVSLLFGAAGFADDSRKLSENSAVGINFKKMAVVQLFITAAYLFVIFFSSGKSPFLFIPFVGNVYNGLLFWVTGLLFGLGSVSTRRLMEGRDGLYQYIGIMSFAAVCVMAFIKGNIGCGIISAAAAGGTAAFCILKSKLPALVSGGAGMMFSGGLLFACSCMLDCPFIMIFVNAVYIIDALYYLFSAAVSGKGSAIHIKMQKSGADEKIINLVYLSVNLVFCTAGIIMMIL